MINQQAWEVLEYLSQLVEGAGETDDIEFINYIDDEGESVVVDLLEFIERTTGMFPEIIKEKLESVILFSGEEIENDT